MATATRPLVPIAECPGLTDAWGVCTRCCLHAPLFAIADVTHACYRWSEYGPPYSDGVKPCSDSGSYAVVQLQDGRFGTFSESEDYTGHGCQCSSNTSVHATLDEAIRFGLGDRERDDFTTPDRS